MFRCVSAIWLLMPGRGPTASRNDGLAPRVSPIGALNSVMGSTLAVNSIGWLELTAQVAAVCNGLPDRGCTSAALVDNYVMKLSTTLR